MKKAVCSILITIVFAVLMSACMKNEEAKTSNLSSIENTSDESYRTDSFMGCTYQVPAGWDITIRD